MKKSISEMLLAEHCAPAMAGIKPSNIVACKKTDNGDINAEIAALNARLNKCDIYIDIICQCRSRVQLIVYRKKVLEEHLADVKNRAFLAGFGYGGAATLDEYFDILKNRLAYEEFPHEIGVFLGYPLRDIYCFINHRNEGCVLVGDWRVYHNTDEARKMFCRFKACKKALGKKIAEGKSLEGIFRAA